MKQLTVASGQVVTENPSNATWQNYCTFISVNKPVYKTHNACW